MKISIPGEPAAAGRPRFNSKTGRTYSPKGNVEYAERVRLAVLTAAKGKPGPYFERGQPLMLTATFFFPRLKSHYGTGKNAGRLKDGAPTYAIGSKDLDNLLKLVKDGLQQAGAIYNDNQVVRYGICEKRYADLPATVVTIETIPSEGALSVVRDVRAEGQAPRAPRGRKKGRTARSKSSNDARKPKARTTQG